MIVLKKHLQVSHVRGANLNDKDSWALVLKDHGMSIIGHDHSKESFIRLNEEARNNLGFPFLHELVNRVLTIQLTAIQAPKEEKDEDRISSLSALWRADKESCSKIFIAGLERHEYVKYNQDMDFGEDGPMAYNLLTDEEKARKLTIQTVTETNSVLIAFFSSNVPTGFSGPPMGMSYEPRYPSYYLALSISSSEYGNLSAILDQSVAFELKILLR